MADKFVFFVTLASVILASYLTYAKNSTVKCHKNAEFVKCASPCPLTCLDVLEKTTPSCTEKCKPDCVCKKGYATSRGYCIKEKECKESYKPHKSSKSSKKESKKDDKKDKKSKCPQHADYKRCSSLCPPTCASIQAKDRKRIIDRSIMLLYKRKELRRE
ncbi:unnamed protein product [Bursaphelenchus okinawaensis]|uniref:TIL domain-containing protein n=1 Tax=Bursaphelenchus okinawaensis TaxID=465554 RepID=A0A811KGX2_9BILA|nr:unnamed protein product [Bursaphelenchus okinawaensis]CAG9102952.1 unnamed protein product [Bursaphelenchus okinawaensis]